MGDWQYHLLMRTEHNKVLMQEAAYERLRHSLGPRRTSREPLVGRLFEQAREWLGRQNEAFLCNKAIPACGLAG